MSYSRDRDLNNTGQKLQGVFLTRPEYPGAVVQPKFSNEALVPTKVLWLGCPNADGTGFLPLRNSSAAYDYGDCITNREIFCRIGTAQKFTFIADLYDENGSRMDDVRNPSPSKLFYNNFRAGARSRPEWELMLKGGAGVGPSIPRPSASAIIQGAVVEHNGREYYNKPLFGIIYMQTSATQALEKLLEDNKGLDFNVDEMPMLSFFNKKFLGQLNKPANAARQINLSGGGYSPSSSGGESKEFLGLTVVLEKGPALDRNANGVLDLIAKNQCARPWNEVLRYLSSDEQVQVLLQAFSNRKDILVETLGDSGLLPESFMSGSVSVTMAPQPVQQKFSPPARPASTGGMKWGTPKAAPAASVTPQATEDNGDYIPMDDASTPAPATTPVAKPAEGLDSKSQEVQNIIAKLQRRSAS